MFTVKQEGLDVAGVRKMLSERQGSLEWSFAAVERSVDADVPPDLLALMCEAKFPVDKRSSSFNPETRKRKQPYGVIQCFLNRRGQYSPEDFDQKLQILLYKVDLSQLSAGELI